MNTTDEFNNLRTHGYRLTPQRLAIIQILDETHGHLSAADIFLLANQRVPGLTEATVYRTLDFLVAHGMALIAHIGSGRIVYESSSHDHHHLICRKCGKSAEISHTDLSALFKQFQTTTGYRIDASHVTFFGLCPSCLADQSTE
jgi:Fur family ferric uptake transcriptional regulator